MLFHTYLPRLLLFSIFVIPLCLAIPGTPAKNHGWPANDDWPKHLNSIPTQAPKRWVHPGVFVSRKQLHFASKKVAAGAQPWSNAFDSMLKYNYSSPTRTAKPYAVVECGPTSTPNIGCYQEREDSMAAYMNALAWWVTGKRRYSQKAIHYMDAWSKTIQSHTNQNAPLQAAWAAANWVRAGELIRHSHAGWSKAGIASFSRMLRNVYIPIIGDGAPTMNGNWELVMMEAAVGAAVFLEDAALYEKSMDIFAHRVPAYIYLKSDGQHPVAARGTKNTTDSIIASWYKQATFSVSGITQETCRDFAHVSYGIASMAHVAETLRHQGFDIWKTDLGARVQAALEFHTPFITGAHEIPEWLCNGKIARTMDPSKLSIDTILDKGFTLWQFSNPPIVLWHSG
ncbi:hypothetical protein ACHAPT_005485 [Fusarium lateritium]